MGDNWPALVSSVHIGGALPMSLSVTCDVLGRDAVVMQMTVPDTRTGEPIVISRSVPVPRLRERAARLQWLREQVHWFYRHEADEQFMVDGIRVFYPEQEHEDAG